MKLRKILGFIIKKQTKLQMRGVNHDQKTEDL